MAGENAVEKIVGLVRGGEAEPPRTLTLPFTSAQKGAGGSVDKNALDTASCILRYILYYMK